MTPETPKMPFFLLYSMFSVPCGDTSGVKSCGAPPHLHRVDIAQQENETRQNQDEEDEDTLAEGSCHGAFLLSLMVT